MAAALVALALLGALPADAEGSAEPNGGSKISVSPTDLAVPMMNGAGTVQPVLTNTGSSTGHLTVEVALDNEHSGCTSRSVTMDPTTISVSPNKARSQPITMKAPVECVGRKGTLILSADNGPPATARISITESFTECQLWFPIKAGIGAAGLFFIWALIAVWKRLGKKVHVGSSWSFKDSWVTNVSALGGVLTTVLAATGFLDSVIPGRTTGRLTGLNLLFMAAVLAAPILYSTFSVWDWDRASDKAQTLILQGRSWAVIVAATVTTFGVVGQLGTLWLVNQVAQDSNSIKTSINACLILAAATVLAYALRFVIGVTKEVPKDASGKQVPTLKRTDLSATL